MKKIAITIILLFVISAFVYGEQNTKIDERVKTEVQKDTVDTVYYKCLKYENMCRWTQVRHFEYKNHKYILFGDDTNRCIIHDPDCQCTKKESHAIQYKQKKEEDKFVFSIDF